MQGHLGVKRRAGDISSIHDSCTEVPLWTDPDLYPCRRRSICIINSLSLSSEFPPVPPAAVSIPYTMRRNRPEPRLYLSPSTVRTIFGSRSFGSRIDHIMADAPVPSFRGACLVVSVPAPRLDILWFSAPWLGSYLHAPSSWPS